MKAHQRDNRATLDARLSKARLDLAKISSLEGLGAEAARAMVRITIEQIDAEIVALDTLRWRPACAECDGSEECPTCGGTGLDDGETCAECQGSTACSACQET